MVLMLWFYISGLVLLTGAEMNAEIEHASPYGKAPGEKVPGEKRKIGPAAMRAWRDGHRAVAPSHPAPSHRDPLALPAPASSGASYWMLGAGVVVAQVWMAIKSLRNRKIGA
jgi:membrane protein